MIHTGKLSAGNNYWQSASKSAFGKGRRAVSEFILRLDLFSAVLLDVYQREPRTCAVRVYRDNSLAVRSASLQFDTVALFGFVAF